jgi:hypothetical protein
LTLFEGFRDIERVLKYTITILYKYWVYRAEL